jgi:hypothetical protein
MYLAVPLRESCLDFCGVFLVWHLFAGLGPDHLLALLNLASRRHKRTLNPTS